MSEEHYHYQVNGKYRVQLERSAVKGIDGFKVEANGDDLSVVESEVRVLYDYALVLTKPESKIGDNPEEGIEK